MAANGCQLKKKQRANKSANTTTMNGKTLNTQQNSPFGSPSPLTAPFRLTPSPHKARTIRKICQRSSLPSSCRCTKSFSSSSTCLVETKKALQQCPKPSVIPFYCLVTSSNPMFKHHFQVVCSCIPFWLKPLSFLVECGWALGVQTSIVPASLEAS